MIPYFDQKISQWKHHLVKYVYWAIAAVTLFFIIQVSVLVLSVYNYVQIQDLKEQVESLN